MERKTNLRALRLRYEIPLSELSGVSGLSNQYISRAELGETSPTPRLEDKLGTAVEAVIGQRHKRLRALERSFAACKGRLLQLEEGDLDE
jgi:transcriptional regulator with XRE-family HTH domain